MSENSSTQSEDTANGDSPLREQKQVLQMVADGKLTPEQAEEILGLLGSENGADDLSDDEAESAEDAYAGLTMAEIEQRVIRQTIERCGGDAFQAAQVLRIPMHQLYRKLGETPARRRGPAAGAGERHRDRRGHDAERRERHRARHERRRGPRPPKRPGPPDPARAVREAIHRTMQETAKRVARDARRHARNAHGWAEDFGEEFGRHMEQFGEEFAQSFQWGPFFDEERDEDQPDRDERAWELPESRTIRVHLAEGDLQIRPSEDDHVRTDRPATASIEDGDLVLRFEDETDGATLQLPADCALTAESGDGSLDIQAVTLREASIHTADGDIHVKDGAGPLKLRTGDGDILVEDVEGGAVEAETGDGDASMKLSGAESLSMRSGAGDLSANISGGIEGPITLDTGDGSASVNGVGVGPVTVKSGSGDLAVNCAHVNGPAELTTGDGDASFNASTALSLRMDSGSGALYAKVGDVEGPVEMRSDDGDIALNVGDASAVALVSGSGAVIVNAGDIADRLEIDTADGDATLNMGEARTVRVRSGSGRVDANLSGAKDEIALETDDGDIQLQIPAELACTIDASTGDGEVRCALPFDGAEAQADTRSLRGTLHGGGVPIRIRTGSGDIAIQSA